MFDSKIAITGIKAIISLLKDLDTHASIREKDRFEKLFVPLFDNLLLTHKDYIRIFSETKKSIPIDWRADEKYNSELNITEDMKVEIKKIRIQFSDNRRLNRGDRDLLRDNIKSILCKANNAYEKRFILSLVLYFIENEPSNQNDEFYDGIIDFISERRSDVLRTPSEEVYTKLRDTNCPLLMESILDEAIDKSNRRFVDVGRYYLDLKLSR